MPRDVTEPSAPTPTRQRPIWVAFLLACFLLTGMVGLFASYGPSIPLERALHRIEAIDRASAAVPPDQAALRTTLGPAGAADLLNGPGDAATRLARARTTIIAEAREDQAGVGARTRLMIYVVTALSAVLGVGIMLLVARQKSD